MEKPQIEKKVGTQFLLFWPPDSISGTKKKLQSTEFFLFIKDLGHFPYQSPHRESMSFGPYAVQKF